MRSIKASLLFLTLIISNDLYASSSVEYFVSNNSQVINMETAYQRMVGNEQLELENTIIDIMQNNHIEQGRFENTLGIYSMVDSKMLTADNSEHYTTSPKQDISETQIFNIAYALAIKLNQESIAVFIPNESSIGEITVSFTTHKPNINEITTLINTKLPSLYGQAFSLQISEPQNNFDNAKVSKITWLGSKIKIAEIKNTFPLENIKTHTGTTYLVYKNGVTEIL